MWVKRGVQGPEGAAPQSGVPPTPPRSCTPRASLATVRRLGQWEARTGVEPRISQARRRRPCCPGHCGDTCHLHPAPPETMPAHPSLGQPHPCSPPSRTASSLPSSADTMPPLLTPLLGQPHPCPLLPENLPAHTWPSCSRWFLKALGWMHTTIDRDPQSQTPHTGLLGSQAGARCLRSRFPGPARCGLGLTPPPTPHAPSPYMDQNRARRSQPGCCRRSPAWPGRRLEHSLRLVPAPAQPT